MSKKRVHEIAKEQGMSPKVALARMQAAGMKVGAASSSVDEATALRALGNGDAQAAEAAPPPAQDGATNGKAKASGRAQTPPKAPAKSDGAKRPSAEAPAPATARAPEAPRASAATTEAADVAGAQGEAGDGGGRTGTPKGEGDPGYKR